MSANGAFTSTLDFDFIAGAVVSVKGPLSVQIDVSADLTGRVPIYGEIQPYTLELAGQSSIETPTLYASATDLSTSFNVSGTIEFGTQIYLDANNSIDFTLDTVPGTVTTHARADLLLEFPSITNIYVFSEGPVSVSTSFSLAGVGLNWDTHIYDRYGANGVRFTGPESNGTNIKIESNGVKLVSNGIGLAEII